MNFKQLVLQVLLLFLKQMFFAAGLRLSKTLLVSIAFSSRFILNDIHACAVLPKVSHLSGIAQ